ncbi:RAMP superfamily CRISPR-associated protein [Desulfotomaculum copahuensis]|uniref:CRISPR type III-associated protein domain-containing protein n=1 Tax=Desulfotomaculum copahuensis TaxID=1838280 RepID=A0A1B7LAF7_9FIRM|nr:RAMP superfamily CRISPR-associated protein [Desulfotomaculum copahuensis]OAT79303.1 hypothetical protein A6M21_16340 [Desulfotomaculum copahuensis]
MPVHDYYSERAKELFKLSDNNKLAALEGEYKRTNDKEKKKQLRQKIKEALDRCSKELQPLEDNGTTVLIDGLAVDCMIWVRGELPCEDDARKWYISHVQNLSYNLPDELSLDNLPAVLLPGWIALSVNFTLETSWYSKDERPLHVLDNPLRKDRVFGVPYMSAMSWKGLLRWACRMQQGLLKHLEEHKMSMDGWNDEPWIRHLFGNERRADEFSRGALVVYPTWFSKIKFEVINPHSRQTRAGTKPIYYEVVPDGTPGVLRILYAPLPGQVERDRVEPRDVLANLLDAVESLLTCYGFSAKRTAGWGKAKIEKWHGTGFNQPPVENGTIQEFKERLGALLVQSGQPEGSVNK